MLKKQFNLFVFVIVALITINSGYAQTATVVGKIISKTDADQLFGPVLQSVSISSAELQNLAQKTPDHILFNFINGQLVILNGTRATALYGSTASVSPSTTFHLYSTSQLLQLIKLGQSATTNVELRKNVLSITNGSETLEYATICPPNCN